MAWITVGGGGLSGGSAGKGSMSGGSGVTSTGGTSTGSGNASAQGGASPSGMGQGGAISSGGTCIIPGQGGVGAGPNSGSGGTSNNDLMCRGIRRGDPCPVETYECFSLRCGLADQGHRDCACTGGIWACTSCDFTGSPIQYPPADLPLCTTQADEMPCDTEWALCQGAPAGEVCACWFSEADGQIWDCDDPPSMWPYP